MNFLINLLLAPFGLCRVVGWMNIYKAGYYHRAGKPTMYDRHPGDLYPTRKAAIADIDPDARHLYVATTKTAWYEDTQPHINCKASKPVPLRESRRQLQEEPGGHFENGAWVTPKHPSQDEIEWARAQAMASAYFPW